MSKKKRSFPTPYTILFLLTIIMAILTQILPAGRYDYKTATSGEIIKAVDVPSYSGDEKLLPIPGTFQPVEANPQGIKEVILAPFEGIIAGIDVIIFVLAIGAFMTMTVKSGALDAGLGRVIHSLNGKESIMIPILILIFSIGGTVYGMQEETVAFYPLVIPMMIKAGYDSIVGSAVVIVGAVMGLIGSMLNPFSVGIASGFAQVSIGDGIGLRLVMFILANIIASAYIMRYAKKVKANPMSSLAYENRDEINKRYFGEGNSDSEGLLEFTKTRKVILFVFVITFVIMIWGVIPFSEWGLPQLELGWWFLELAGLFLVAAIIIGLIARFSEKEIVANIQQGASDFITVGLVIGLARGVTLIMDHGLLKDSILHFAEVSIGASMSPSLLVALVFLLFIPLGFLITSTSGLATLSMPIMAPVAVISGLSASLVVSAFLFGQSILFIINPADAILSVAITYAGISYAKWFKFIYPLFIMLFVLCIVVLVLGAMF